MPTMTLMTQAHEDVGDSFTARESSGVSLRTRQTCHSPAAEVAEIPVVRLTEPRLCHPAEVPVARGARMDPSRKDCAHRLQRWVSLRTAGTIVNADDDERADYACFLSNTTVPPIGVEGNVEAVASKVTAVAVSSDVEAPSAVAVAVSVGITAASAVAEVVISEITHIRTSVSDLLKFRYCMCGDLSSGRMVWKETIRPLWDSSLGVGLR